jgi:hypothetical protein
MRILRLIADWLSKLKQSTEAMLDPGTRLTKPQEALVKVRLVDLLPPDLPGWPSKHLSKRR